MKSPRQRRAVTVSQATPRAAVTPARVPARGEWGRDSPRLPPPLPPRPPSVWAGPAKEENERNTTLRGLREARGEERVSAEWCESEWKTEKVREEREVPF